MEYKTIITESAESDIASAVHYLAYGPHNQAAAMRLLDDIERSVASLQETPERHPFVKNEHLASSGFRFLPIQNYIVFYIVRKETCSVTIERFLHSRRDWMNII